MGSASCALEQVRRYGVASLFPGFQRDFPFIIYAQSVPRPAWSGKRDFHGERLHQAYEFLIYEVVDNAASHAVEMENLLMKRMADRSRISACRMRNLMSQCTVTTEIREVRQPQSERS